MGVMDIVATVLGGLTILMGIFIWGFNLGLRLGRQNVLAQQKAEELIAMCDPGFADSVKIINSVKGEEARVVEMYESPWPQCPRCHKGYDTKGRCDCDRREFPARDSGA